MKSDNIEELFREAAEKYHIDTAGAEAWDDVKAAVHADDVQPTPPPDGKRKRKWFALGWLLLIPLGWFAHNIWTAIHEPKNTHLTELFAKTGLPRETVKAFPPRQEIKKTDANKQTAVATTTPQGMQSNKNEKPPFTGTGGILADKQGNSLMHVKQAEPAGNNFNTRPGSSLPRAGIIDENKQVSVNAQAGAAAITKNEAAPLLANSGAGKINEAPAKTGLPQEGPVSPDNKNGQPVLNSSAGKEDNIAGGKQAANKPKDKTKNSHYFYAGLAAAPDVSFIHFQKTSTLGEGVGLLLGYHINKNVSIESGVLVEKKYYYTDGEYFNINKIPYFVANNIHPESANGNCNMVEIPINLRYTFKTKGGNSFYAIGGISSYLMGHEQYTFNYNEWGTPMQSSWAYNNAANYWFSILNLGAGYERKLGTKTNVRIEPYMKLPLSGIGTGNLKIASAGLYITLTRKLP